MSVNALYTDLSGYYDLMCADIDYQAQSHCIHRLQQLFGNGGARHLDMACGTGPHIRHFIDAGYASSGLDINQPMLDLAQSRRFGRTEPARPGMKKPRIGGAFSQRCTIRPVRPRGRIRRHPQRVRAPCRPVARWWSR